MTLRFPAEWEPHEATWMGFPPESYPGSGVSSAMVQKAWSEVANTVADHEPVHMLVRPDQLALARRMLSEQITLHDVMIDDAWLRDSGPSFVIDGKTLAAVNWRFNGWGDNTSFDWQNDAQIATHIAGILGIPVIDSTLTNEGGGFHVNGSDTVLLTETVQRDPHRNPDWEQEAIESEIHRQLGTSRGIWFERGLHRDYEDNGTRGHIDMVACFCSADRVLLHHQANRDHPDHSLYTGMLNTLHGAGLQVTDLPAPRVLKDNIDWVDYSYINHYVINGAVIQPTFDDPHDMLAKELLQEAWPGREIRGVDARAIFAMGGGIHCITQQQPRLA